MTVDTAGLDRLILEPTRLRICGFLAPLEEADFGALRDDLDVSESALSKHMARLEAAGYVSTRKDTFDGRRSWAGLTGPGRRVLAAHVEALQRIAGVAVGGAG